MVQRLKHAKKAERDALRRECLSFASAIIESWTVGGRDSWRQKSEGVDRNVFAKLLSRLDDPELVRRFLVKVIPADAAQLSCNCRDCCALSEFLADPDRREARFPLAKERRRHVHTVIDRDHCDCTHVTEHRGSPDTLVCTKTTASYDAACEIYERDLKNLSRIAALVERQSTG